MIKQNIKIVLIILLIGAGFFCFEKSCLAISAGDVVINEICWMGTSVSSADEWIELYNNTNEEINLENWGLYETRGETLIEPLIGVIKGKSYYLIERTDDNTVPHIEASQFPTSWGGYGLNDSGEYLQLLNADLIIVDEVNCEEHWSYGNKETKQTMERIINGWQTSLNSGGTPKAPNSDGQPEPEPEPDTEEKVKEEEDEEENEQPEPQEQEQEEAIDQEVIKSYNLGDIVINEFVSDPTDNDVEWIELYNNTNQEINLTNWTIEEGSGAKTTLEGIVGSNNESKFFVIEKPKGNLNNKGDIIILRDNTGTLIDQVAYGNWDDGNISNNAPVASDPYSVARKFDGQNSFNNANDFSVTTTLTKGASNIITKTEEELELVDEVSAEERLNYDYSDNIVISEIFPNPEGSDNETEFIELFNFGDKEVDLTGWLLGDNSKKRHKIFSLEKENIIKAKEYFVIYRNESKIALNNSGDSVKLYQPLEDEPFQTVDYGKAVEGWSLNISNLKFKISDLTNDNYIWSEAVTPEKENIVEKINHPPIVEFDCPEKILIGVPFLFDGSDTMDQDEDALTYEWDFGDGFINNLSCPEHTFFQIGAYTVKLMVSDGENKIVKEKIIKIVSDLNITSEASEGEQTFIRLQMPQTQDNIIINEFLPNPKGSDTEGEWIEIKNKSEIKINLLDWKLDDNINGSRPYKFAEDTWLGGGMFLSVARSESGLALNNDFDSVRLLDNFDELIDEIKYEQVVEGRSYARGQNGKWFWTNILTRGEENIISVSGSDVLGINNYESGEIGIEPGVIETTLEEIRQLEPGDMIKVSGTVAVKPGILGSQYFYIVGSPGVQIYNYNKKFPDLEIGDYIEVQGELSAGSGEPRIKTSNLEDIKIIERRDPPEAGELTCENINEDSIGRLVSITGEVVERKSSVVYLDDGTSEAIVYIKATTGISPASIKEGDMVKITGIVGRTASGLRVMPRSNDDIIRKDVEGAGSASQVFGEVPLSGEWEIATRDKKIELFKYLLVIAGGAIIVLTGLLIKEARKA